MDDQKQPSPEQQKPDNHMPASAIGEGVEATKASEAAPKNKAPIYLDLRAAMVKVRGWISGDWKRGGISKLEAKEAWPLFLGFIAIAVAAWTLRVLSVQMDIMNGQLQEMRSGSTDTHMLAEAAKAQSEQAQRQTDEMGDSLTKTDDLIRQATDQAKATNRLAQSSETSVTVARNNLELAENALQVQQRPWVGILMLTGSFEDGKMKSKVTFRNYGKSPAFRVSVHARWDEKQPMVIFAPPWQSTDSKSVMFPEQVLESTDSTAEATGLGLAKLEHGLGSIYFYGEITYEDMFTYESNLPKIHTTHFCGFWDMKAKKLVDCSSYNDAD